MNSKRKLRFRGKKLDEIGLLCIQIAIRQERDLILLSEILRNIPLEQIEDYWKEVCNGDVDKKRYYENAREIVGKRPNIEVLKRDLLNYRNKAYMEFLKKYR